jgi:hypothetical protein
MPFSSAGAASAALFAAPAAYAAPASTSSVMPGRGANPLGTEPRGRLLGCDGDGFQPIM